MNDKLVAGIVTAGAITPLCAVCVLGPAAIGSLVAGAFGWLGEVGPLLTVALMAAAGFLVHRTLRRRHQPNGGAGEDTNDTRRLTTRNSGPGTFPTGPGVRSVPSGDRT